MVFEEQYTLLRRGGWVAGKSTQTGCPKNSIRERKRDVYSRGKCTNWVLNAKSLSYMKPCARKEFLG